jgi:hypothetical protein
MSDLVQRRQALEVLMSYNPFWLRLAAEVVTQKPVQMQGGDQSAHRVFAAAACATRPCALSSLTCIGSFRACAAQLI